MKTAALAGLIVGFILGFALCAGLWFLDMMRVMP